jgi:hypothetical protein
MTLNSYVVSVLVSALVGLGLGVLVCKMHKPEPPAVALPKEVVVEKIVTKIVTKNVPFAVPGKPVEHIKLVTKEAPVEKVKLVAVSKFENPIGRVRLEGLKYQGLRDDKAAFGWAGVGIAEIRDAANPEDWLKLFESPVDLEASTAEVVKDILPESMKRQKRLRLDLGVGAGSTGVAGKAGFAWKIEHKTRLGEVLAPDHFGVDLLYVDSRPALIATLGKDF